MEDIKFKCDACNLIFAATGTRKEWNDPVFGPCWKMVAPCPGCESETGTYKRPKPSKERRPEQLPRCQDCTNRQYAI